jgi:HK97 gp10 family phage protein
VSGGGGIAVDVLGGNKLQRRLDRLSKSMPVLVTKGVLAGALVFERGMKRRAPVGRTGATRNSIRAEVKGIGYAEVGPHEASAMYNEFGTGLHTEYPGAAKRRIVPISASAMRWTAYSGKGMKNGTVVFARSTQGMVPHPFVRPTAHEDKAAAMAAVRRVIKGGVNSGR